MTEMDAARSEQRGEPKTYRFRGNGGEFELPPSPPVAAMIAAGKLVAGDLSGMEMCVRSLFRDRMDDFLALEPDLTDLEDALNVYGEDFPESRASDGFSKRSGRRSRRTSSGSTASTSPASASAPSR